MLQDYCSCSNYMDLEFGQTILNLPFLVLHLSQMVMSHITICGYVCYVCMKHILQEDARFL